MSYIMQRIVPNFWFDHNAEEAVDFYLSVFKDGKINATLHYPKTEEEAYLRLFPGLSLETNPSCRTILANNKTTRFVKLNIYLRTSKNSIIVFSSLFTHYHLINNIIFVNQTSNTSPIMDEIIFFYFTIK